MFINATSISTGSTSHFEAAEKNTAERILLLDIFPVNNNSLNSSHLSTTLRKYLSFILLAQEALDKFEKRIMPFFDPLVGENACQIRAAMFTEIVDKDGIDEHTSSTRKQLTDHADKIQDLIAHQNDKFLKVDSFKSFLQQKDAILEISEEISVIISSFILSETKVIEYIPNDLGTPYPQERISYKNFGQKKGLTPKFASAIIKVAQAKLSEISVFYVQRLALHMPLSKEEKDTSMLVFGNFVKQDEFHRKLTPFFPTLRLVLKRMHQSKIPLILKVKQYIKGSPHSYGTLTLEFRNRGTDEYRFINKHPESYKKGAVLIHTKSITEEVQSSDALKDKILRLNITDLILSAAADHPAYGSDDRDRPEDPLCDRYRSLAREWGTCRSNPSLFLVEHICCDLVYVDSHGRIVETVYLSSKQKAKEFYDTISDLGGYQRERLKLLGGGKVVPEATIINKELIDLSMAETRLNNATILALESRTNPSHREYPIKKYKLKVIDE